MLLENKISKYIWFKLKKEKNKPFRNNKFIKKNFIFSNSNVQSVASFEAVAEEAKRTVYHFHKQRPKASEDDDVTETDDYIPDVQVAF